MLQYYKIVLTNFLHSCSLTTTRLFDEQVQNTVLETHDFCLYDRRSTLSIRIFSKILKAQELLVPPSWVLCDFVDSFASMPATVGKSEKNVGVPFFSLVIQNGPATRCLSSRVGSGQGKKFQSEIFA